MRLWALCIAGEPTTQQRSETQQKLKADNLNVTYAQCLSLCQNKSEPAMRPTLLGHWEKI